MRTIHVHWLALVLLLLGAGTAAEAVPGHKHHVSAELRKIDDQSQIEATTTAVPAPVR